MSQAEIAAEYRSSADPALDPKARRLREDDDGLRLPDKLVAEGPVSRETYLSRPLFDRLRGPGR